MKRSILYLDDEVACIDVFQEMFGDDFDVRTAATLSDARRAMHDRAADIVISDRRMPEIDGTEFLREVSELYPASYRVMLTGSATLGDLIHEISDGVVNLFVAKPWTEQSMRGILERASSSFELRQMRMTCAAQGGSGGEAVHTPA